MSNTQDYDLALTLERLFVVSALVLLSMVTYIDRTAISTAKGAVAGELHLSDVAMGMVFSAFALGYALAQIPSGWLADTLGPRAVLGGSVAIWSVLTVLTGAAWNFGSLLAFLFLFGIGEAAVFPASARAFRNWLLPEQRGRANGALFAGSRIGAALSYPLLVWMLTIYNWRESFRVLGILGLVWATAWTIWFRDFPSPHSSSGIRQNRPQARPAPPNGLPVPRLAPAMAQYFASNFTNFICLSWMFPYLQRQYRLSSAHAALYSMVPLLLGATSQGIAGWMIDRLFSSRLRVWSRRVPAIIGFALSGAGLIIVINAHFIQAAVFGFAVAVFGADMTISPSWVFCADIAGNRTGKISGAMNMFGNIGAFVSANAFPLLSKTSGGSSVYFCLAVALDIGGILCWIRMRSVQPEALVHDRHPAEVNSWV